MSEVRRRRTLRGRLRGVADRVGWAAADQALSAGSNGLLGVFLARQLTREAFGAFGLVFAVYIVLLLIYRGLGSTVLQVRFSAAAASAQAGAIRDSTGLALLLGLVPCAPLLLAGHLAGGSTGSGLQALALVLGPLLLQDAWRMALFTLRRPRSAAANDLIWVLIEFPLLGLLAVSNHVSTASGILVWGAGALGGALYGIRQTRVWPSLRGGLRWVWIHRDLGIYQTAEFILIAGTTPLILLILGILVGLQDIATLRAADLIASPLQLALTAVLLIALPEAARLHKEDRDRLPHVLAFSAAAFGVLAVLVGAAALVIPPSVGEAIVGSNWHAARPLMLPLSISFAAAGFTTAWLIGLRILQAARDTFLLQLLFAPFLVGAGVVGMLVAGPFGSACGTAAVTALTVLPMRAVFRRRFATAEAGASSGGHAESPREAPAPGNLGDACTSSAERATRRL